MSQIGSSITTAYQRMVGNCRNLLESGQYDSAIAMLKELQEQQPRDTSVLRMLGHALMMIDFREEAIRHLSFASKLEPNNVDLLVDLCGAYRRIDQIGKAHQAVDKALKIRPGFPRAVMAKARLLQSHGNSEQAYEHVKATLEAHKDPDVVAVFGQLCRELKRQHEAIDIVRQTLERADMSRNQRQDLLFSLGHLLDSVGEYDEAFDCFAKGNGMSAEYPQFEYGKWVNNWTKENFDAIPESDIDGSRCVFIVGMPRSGTSLTEQMLAQLKDIEPGGEMNVIDAQIHRSEKAAMRHSKPLPVSPTLYTQPVIDSMSKDAMKAYNKVHRRKSITDKQPYNYLLVPMIAHILPGAKIIHCTRDPLDCCFSNYTTAFTQLHMQTHDQYWLGRYYADYERVMDAWHQLPEVEMIDLPYEELVRDAEGQMRRVVEFIGHEWDDSVLRFHESERKVITASRDQVKKKLYTSSIAKYAPYEHRLDELKRGLEEGRSRESGTVGT